MLKAWCLCLLKYARMVNNITGNFTDVKLYSQKLQYVHDLKTEVQSPKSISLRRRNFVTELRKYDKEAS
jgi:hypothetical protein